MTTDQLHLLFEKWLSGTITAQESDTFMQFVREAGDEVMERLITNSFESVPPLHMQSAQKADLIYRHIIDAAAAPAPLQETAPARRVHFLKSAWLRYAAMLLVLAGTGAYFYMVNQAKKEIALKTLIEKPGILPGGNKAILTLADGSTILLDSAATGSLTEQGNTKVIKLDAGSLAYKPGNETGEVGFNTISTPNGGLYQVMLPDGSRTWLNAGSSITFPTAFVGNRNVTVTGEVYFEINNDKNKPFQVAANGEQINVLGTSFNVNAYRNEPSVKTSLLEGSIKINTVVLKPGQAYDGVAIVTTNLQQDLAWKNGLFNFEGLNVAAVMRQIERWYDVKVVYEKGIPDIVFAGKIKRNISLNNLLKILADFGVNSRMDVNNQMITILP